MARVLAEWPLKSWGPALDIFRLLLLYQVCTGQYCALCTRPYCAFCSALRVFVLRGARTVQYGRLALVQKHSTVPRIWYNKLRNTAAHKRARYSGTDMGQKESEDVEGHSIGHCT
eukprot:1275759-Rhodomonas_salina.1